MRPGMEEDGKLRWVKVVFIMLTFYNFVDLFGKKCSDQTKPKNMEPTIIKPNLKTYDQTEI